MNQIEQFLVRIRSLLIKMSKLEQLIDDCVKSGSKTAAFEHSLELERLSESYTLFTREMPQEFGIPKAVGCVDEVIRESFPCEIGYTKEGWFRLVMPMLLPKKSRNGSVDYIRGALYPQMYDYFRKHRIERLSDCVIIFRHVYEKDTPHYRRRDHDNIEVKQVTDIVAWFTMTDDGPDICRHYYCSASGSQNRTEVYVVPKLEFPFWMILHEN